jgi:hypothetical protein
MQLGDFRFVVRPAQLPVHDCLGAFHRRGFLGFLFAHGVTIGRMY